MTYSMVRAFESVLAYPPRPLSATVSLRSRAMRLERLVVRMAHGPVRSTLLVLLMCIAPACGSNDNPTGPGSSGGGATGGAGSLSPGTMRATIDGTAWTGAINVAAIATGNFLVITGASDIGTPGQILLSLSTPAQVGPQTVASNLVVGSYVTSPTVGWLAAGPSGSGTVTVSSLTATSATGTFSFVMFPNTGSASPTKVVTDGAFSARIPTP